MHVSEFHKAFVPPTQTEALQFTVPIRRLQFAIALCSRLQNATNPKDNSDFLIQKDRHSDLQASPDIVHDFGAHKEVSFHFCADPSTFAQDLFQIYLTFPTERTMCSSSGHDGVFTKRDLLLLLTSTFCQSSDTSSHTWWSSKSIRMSLYYNSLAQTDVSTQTPSSAFISSRENHSATKFTMLSICDCEHKGVTIIDLRLLLVSRIFSSSSTHPTVLVSTYSLFLQSLCQDSTSLCPCFASSATSLFFCFLATTR